MKLEPEVLFIRYAFPCSHILCKVREEVGAEEFEQMREAAVERQALPQDFLEKVFFRAFTRIEQIAREMQKNKWDSDVIFEYFRKRHNAVVDASDYPESFKTMCRVHEATVISLDENEVIVEYDGGKRRRVKNGYELDLKIRDKVTIHWEYVVEKIN